MSGLTWSNEELAKAWIERYSHRDAKSLILPSDLPDSAQSPPPDTFWAFETLNSLVANDPLAAWRTILLILKLARDNQHVLDNLAAGPLESLISRHGRMAVEWIEEEARENKAFKELLAGVWKSNIPKLIWDRVERASK
ncbi:MAG TPA: hypothetical protein VK794_08940 [Steroidobacteraceae bacterium]|nr:hypothetical protein [Steroidobacteraceae bacterium]